MLDFKELSKDGIKFEQLIREILIREGFETHWTGIGPDNGRDLIITEQLIGKLSSRERKWIVSCKHNANSGKSVNREDLGNIVSDCQSINAEGFILACSTQPSASVVTRLEEISKNQNIITKFWDAIEIEKKLLYPNTFDLIHTFFPESSKYYQWKVYNAYSPSFWAANYKTYFLYLSSRDASTFPDLKSVEEIVDIFENVKIYEDTNYSYASHEFRIRAVYYDNKHCTFTVFLDYLYPKNCSIENILKPNELYDELKNAYCKKDYHLNDPDWDVRYVEANFESDHFHNDHKDYYEPYIKNYEKGTSRNEFLHDVAFNYEMMMNNKIKTDNI